MWRREVTYEAKVSRGEIEGLCGNSILIRGLYFELYLIELGVAVHQSLH